MSDTPNTPALTADEWARPHHDVQCFDSWSDEHSEKTGVGEISAGPDYLRLTSHQHTEIADFSAPSDRHALAALCLYGQPFGFTQADVDVLWQLPAYMRGLGMGKDPEGAAKYVTALGAKIAALLPPVP